MTTIIIIISLSFVLGILVTQRSWQKHIQEKAANKTAVTVGGNIYYVITDDEYYKVFLRNCKV